MTAGALPRSPDNSMESVSYNSQRCKVQADGFCVASCNVHLSAGAVLEGDEDRPTGSKTHFKWYVHDVRRHERTISSFRRPTHLCCPSKKADQDYFSQVMNIFAKTYLHLPASGCGAINSFHFTPAYRPIEGFLQHPTLPLRSDT